MFDEVIAPSQADGSVSALMTEARSVTPDIVFINADVAQAGVLIRKARQLGIESQLDPELAAITVLPLPLRSLKLYYLNDPRRTCCDGAF